MRNKLIWIFATILILGSAPVPGLARLPAGPVEQAPPGAPIPEKLIEHTPNAWFVEFKSPALRSGGARAEILSDRNHFKQDASQVGIRYSERRAFSTLWNGISIELDASQVNLLARLPSVKAIFPVETIPLPETSPMENPEMATALAMTGADVAQSELGYTGEGIRVAVMDTGIDYLHPDLGGGFGPGYKVAVGWDFVGDAFTGDPSGLNPDPYPMDCNGHGTHVAGIIGAEAAAPGGVTGVAPDVTLGAYRVFGCSGSTTSDIMLAAMERALLDDMDILNMSIGSAYQWPQYPTSVAADQLVQLGMVVVASIGNSGATGLYSAGAPGVAEKVIGVASFENTHIAISAFTISPDDTQIGYIQASGAPPAPTTGTFPMARTGTGTTLNDACNAATLPPGSLTGKVALIRRGTCLFNDKVHNAQNAGAVAVVIYNNAPGWLTPTISGTWPITIPVVSITDVEGLLIDSRLASGTVDLTWTNSPVTSLNPTGGVISSFSSYGIAPDLSLKPDIGAPGGMIRSTYPQALGSYATLSGTSMSSPHVAGAVALLLEARPGTLPDDVQGLLQNSALPKPWSGNPGGDSLEYVHRQGAGMLQIDKAIQATTRIEPSEIALGESQVPPALQTLTVYNSGTEAVTYDLSFVNALSTGPNTFLPASDTSNASVAFSSPYVEVPAGGMTAVEATFTPATGPDLGLYGGYIVFTPQGGGQVYRVPFAGFIGDYQDIKVMTSLGNGLPLLASTSDEYYFSAITTAGTVFSMQGLDSPYVIFQFHHQSSLFRMEILPEADLVKEYDLAVYESVYNGRNSASNTFYYLSWDGTAVEDDHWKPLPDGGYRIRLSLLKALGDPEDPAHWETWTSPLFTIDRTIDWGVSVDPLNGEQWGSAGSSVEQALTITNTGTQADTFELEAGPSAWPVSLSEDVTGPLDPGESTVVVLEMEIPIGALPGDSATVDITATSQTGDETATATASLQVTVHTMYGLSITLDCDTQSGYAGETVEYIFNLRHFSNITDTYDITLGDNGWPTSVSPPAAGPLNPGSQATVTVSVKIPANSPGGSSDHVDVTFKSRANPQFQGTIRLTTRTRMNTLYMPFASR